MTNWRAVVRTRPVRPEVAVPTSLRYRGEASEGLRYLSPNGDWCKASSIAIRRGFTVIELLVVLAAVAVLLSIATPRYLAHLDRANELALRHNLKTLREAIDQYRADKGVWPAALPDLVTNRYLREVPEDPVTRRRDTWVLVPPGAANVLPADGGVQTTGASAVADVRSGAPGASKDGSPYASW